MTVVPNTIPPTLIDLKAILAGLADKWPKSDKIDTLSAKLMDRPAQNTLIILGLAAVLFYYAERNENEKVDTIYDALEYCSSSLSVGYTSIYPQTALGKTIATLLMTYGPALSGAMLEGPRGSAKESEPDATQQRILATLEEILKQLREP